MEVTYIDDLLNLLNNQDISKETSKDMLTVNLYLTLIILNGKKNPQKIKDKEKNTIKDFLRKLNNLKVKIQLKRKESEIDKLKEEIIKLYQENSFIIEKFNLENIDIINTINSKEPKEITLLIDKMTKLQINLEDKQAELEEKTKKIIETADRCHYYIEDNIIHIDDITITIDEFKNIFDYLLNIDNYEGIYKNQTQKKSQIEIVGSIIKLILGDYQQENLDKIIFPIILTHILKEELTKDLDIDTSSFNVENIKISDLYSFANQNENLGNNKSKWRNIFIPDEYLFSKLKELILNGMYYFKEDKFILENIIKNGSDFKVSIETDKLKEFLRIILQNKIANLNSKRAK